MSRYARNAAEGALLEHPDDVMNLLAFVGWRLFSPCPDYNNDVSGNDDQQSVPQAMYDFLDSNPNPGRVGWDGLTMKFTGAAISSPPHLEGKSPCISP